MEALSPEGCHREEWYMTAKVPLGISLILATTAGSVATWAAQQADTFTLSDETLIPLGLVVSMFGFSIWVVVKVVRQWDGRGNRLGALEDAVLGTEGVNGRRSGGLVEDVRAIRRKLEETDG